MFLCPDDNLSKCHEFSASLVFALILEIRFGIANVS